MNCPNCGGKITDNQQVCSKCGNILHMNSSDDQDFEKLMNKRKKTIIIAISAAAGIIAATVVIIILVMSGVQNNTSAMADTTSVSAAVESSSVKPITISSVVGSNYKEALQSLTNSGLIVQTEYEYSDVIAENYIIRQSPEAGTVVNDGDTVKLTVSKGAQSTTAGKDSSYVIFGSDTNYLTAESVNGMSARDLELARNEIYARHGRKFNDSYLQTYFNSKAWYKGTIEPEDFSDSVLNSIELSNIETLINAENQLKNADNNSNDYYGHGVDPVFDIVTASSTLPDDGEFSYSPSNVLNYQGKCWVENSSGVGIGEWIKLESNSKETVSGIAIKNGYTDSISQYNNNGKVTRLRFEFSDGSSYTTSVSYSTNPESLSDINSIQYIDFGRTINTRYIKVIIENAISGALYDDTCISYLSPYV